MGPAKAAAMFAHRHPEADSYEVTLYGSLAATGKGHLTDVAVIDALSEENSRMKDESGSKAYLMVDAIVGFENALPEYGVGLTIGSRVGNSLMLEAGADYMLGSSMADLRSFSMDDLVFRAGIGWMF